MNDRRLLAAVGGFAFVAAWIGFGFGQALLCVLGAALCWLGAGIAEGKVDLGQLQSRLSGEEEAPAAPSVPPQPPRSAGRARVQ
jgi:hypothetical protein